jgi:crotonobetainyl-CoA:carnitine CoA-transferase CaiB-like acyl-CoA transferase
MAAVLMSVNERAHVDLEDLDTGAEPAVLGATSGSFFKGPEGKTFVTAQSLIGSLSFPSYLRAMRRADLAFDPRFASAELRQNNFKQLYAIVQTWMLTFRDMATLDAQLDEAKIAMGEIRSLKELSETEWAQYWGAVREVSDRHGSSYKLHGLPWKFSDEVLPQAKDPAFRGEHNREVVLELGFGEDEIAALTQGGALVQHVPVSAANNA